MIFILLLSVIAAVQGNPDPCPSEIYCHGPLLHTIQMASIFKDSKTFVDMKMKWNISETLLRFDDMMNKTGSSPTIEDVKVFVDANFDPAGSEFESWYPTDWREDPLFLKGINDRNLKKWAEGLNDLWKVLGRKMKDEVKDNIEQYSIIYVPNPVIVPGGRFREFYYWDSYWIVRGLLLSEMFDTVKGMLSNFLSIVDRYGMIPNGGRIYYQQRSQPPLLIPMVESYLQATDDLPFLEDSIEMLEKEFDFWLSNHTALIDKDGVSYRLALYGDFSQGPRPESYREDVNSAQWMTTENDKNAFYAELKAAAESGWDFSTRWFINANGSAYGNLTNTRVRSIVPVELNAILYWNAMLLSKFHDRLNNTLKSEEYKKIADEWLEAINQVLWHEEVGSWLDYDMINNMKRDYFYPTNIAPLWTGAYDSKKKEYYVSNVLKYLDKTNIKVNVGGIPSTLIHSGEQWDYPNAWPPLQYIFIVGLENTGDVHAQRVAYDWAEKWIRSNYEAYSTTHAMYEKYDATVVGEGGGGGEYEVQLGFGWSNGVVMELLDMYGDRLTSSTAELPTEPPANTASVQGLGTAQYVGQLVTLALAFSGTLAAGAFSALLCIRYHLRPGYDKLQSY
ncbi:trehalase [Halyomorpha halys]|uniref:trehalase n=1 Tax=Halyomorpha halys TaxID=286706 RepID=UPI0006D4DE8B|nr:trehalase [Halyomorpha halys]XP_014281750.1 trehalase [Halyomorpha halys]XP_014281751.1 trehalase [Halyomorpha halys]